MDSLPTRSQLDMARNANDLSSLNSLREAIANGQDKEALQETAQQFESIFVQMMLKSMRKAQDALSDENSPFNSQQVKFYRDMHDQQLAVDLTSNGGMGLADIIVKQLGQNNPDYTPASAIRSDGNLSSLGLQMNQQQPARPEQAVAYEGPAFNEIAGENTATKGPVFKSAASEALSSEIPAYGTMASEIKASDIVTAKPAAFKAPIVSDKEAFVAALYPHAKQAAEKIGADPKAIIAQAAVETGWGQQVIHGTDGAPSYNLFGIKANNQWQGKQAVVDTLEFSNGVAARQKASFRAYDSIADSMNDYVDFIKSGARYEQAVQNSHDAKIYYQSLQQAGYATDPAYADKLMSVYQGNTLASFNP